MSPPTFAEMSHARRLHRMHAHDTAALIAALEQSFGNRAAGLARKPVEQGWWGEVTSEATRKHA